MGRSIWYVFIIIAILLHRSWTLNKIKQNSHLLCILNIDSSSLSLGNPFYTGNDADTKKQVHFHKDTLVIVASSEVSDNWKGKKYIFFYLNIKFWYIAIWKVAFSLNDILCTLEEYLNMLSETKVQRGILLFSGPMSNAMLNELNDVLDEHNTNTFFYMVYNVPTEGSNVMKPIDNGPYHMIWNQVRKLLVLLDWK